MVRTRFSPSPTGFLHLGNVRAALFSALYAKKCNGHFILRIEDTDATRSEVRYADILQEDLRWLGIDWQEGPVVGGPNAPYFQSQRQNIYEKYYHQLEEKKLAYPCFCSDQELAVNRKIQLSRGQPPRYPGTCRELDKEEIMKRLMDGKKPALRFRVPLKKSIDFVDSVKGPQHFNSDDIGDFIIRRADGSSSFMFCNAIDDSLMNVTNVLRGEDHLANTPRQLMILESLELRAPSYGHLSLITGDDGAKLSKREESFSLRDLREEGYLSQAVLNYLSRLSHAYDDPRLLSFDELASLFHLEKLSRSSARFDKNQLMHWQKEAVMALDHQAIVKWLGNEIVDQVPNDVQDLFVDVIRPNICFPKEAIDWIAILFGSNLHFTDEQKAILDDVGPSFFVAVQQALQKHGANLKNILEEVKQSVGVSGKRLFMPIRIALTGQPHGPELLQIVSILGEKKMKLRFEQALELVENAKNL